MERSTEPPRKHAGVGGEPMSKGPTVGKVKPDMTLVVRNYRGDNKLNSHTVSMKLQRLTEQAKRYPVRVFTSLAHLMDVDFLEEAFGRLRKDGASGIDSVTAADYGKNLKGNLEDLHSRLVSKQYRAQPVKRVWIPKGANSKRPIGVCCFEDKLVQKAVAMILGAIYEVDFMDISYGFREKRSCHQALAELRRQYDAFGISWLLDADVEGFFDHLDHKILMSIIKKRVNDGSVLRLVGKWLKVGVLDGVELFHPETGTPQGGVISPLLANIYLHEVLDTWFDEVVKPRMEGRVFLIRYADDFVIGCESERDARRLKNVLPHRFSKFGLRINSEKTHLVKFQRPGRWSCKCKSNGTFDFLGFTHYLGKSLKGYWVLKRKTMRKRLCRAMKSLWDWCKEHRHDSLEDQCLKLNQKLKGHYAYYGVRCNLSSLRALYSQTRMTWKYWLSRRCHKGYVNHEKLDRILEAYPLPVARIKVAI